MTRKTLMAAVCACAPLAAGGVCLAPLRSAGCASRVTVAVVLAARPDSPVRIAARELRAGLSRLYTGEVFGIFEGEAPAEARTVVHLGTQESLPEFARPLAERLQGAESYIVTTTRREGRREGLILGADPAGAMYGVHGLLQRLGCGSYLSFDTEPPPGNKPFSFGDWDLADHPLAPTRIVFNWHNFLTGCSTWNLKDWRLWVEQSQKMGFNTIMVHAYGNNPMAGFRFRDKYKPVGYLGSTRLGRSWFVNHVNDVRQMHGGEVFSSPVFGSTAAIDGSCRERIEAAQGLMRRVFELAKKRGMKVVLAIDIDTPPANPQELVTLLDESDRFEVGGQWLPDPDTPGGREFYESQVRGLLRAYPTLDTLALWHRTGGTPWMRFERKDMPEAWQKEYDSTCREKPGTDTLWHARHLFGMAKVVATVQRVLQEMHHPEVSVAFGSWNYSFLEAADRFLPDAAALIPLDYGVLVNRSQLRDARSREVIRKVAAHRPVLPIVWAQHDDGRYVVPPFKPLTGFQDCLDDARCAAHGFGILHWMTRPLDLYFSSLARQTWSRTRNEAFETTCRRAARDWLGPAHEEVFGRYLQQWVEGGPRFARETSNWFVDRPLDEPRSVAEKIRGRLEPLRGIDAASLTPSARDCLERFRGMEKFTQEIHRLESVFRETHRLLQEGRLEGARKLARSLDGEPERVIRELAGALQRGGITCGEQGLIVTLNTRWLPHYVRLRQRLGLAAIRYNFGRTVHDPIAPRPGRFTLHFDPEKRIWQTLGERETGASLFSLRSGELCMGADVSEELRPLLTQGIVIDKELTIGLRPIIHDAGGCKGVKPSPRLAAGSYRLVLWTILSNRHEKRSIDLTLASNGTGIAQWAETVDVDRKGPMLASRMEHGVTLPRAGDVKLTMRPREGVVMLSALSLQPAGARGHAR